METILRVQYKEREGIVKETYIKDLQSILGISMNYEGANLCAYP